MNKGELVDKLYRENSLTKRECREMVGALCAREGDSLERFESSPGIRSPTRKLTVTALA